MGKEGRRGYTPCIWLMSEGFMGAWCATQISERACQIQLLYRQDAAGTAERPYAETYPKDIDYYFPFSEFRQLKVAELQYLGRLTVHVSLKSLIRSIAYPRRPRA